MNLCYWRYFRNDMLSNYSLIIPGYLHVFKYVCTIKLSLTAYYKSKLTHIKTDENSWWKFFKTSNLYLNDDYYVKDGWGLIVGMLTSSTIIYCSTMIWLCFELLFYGVPNKPKIILSHIFSVKIPSV